MWQVPIDFRVGFGLDSGVVHGVFVVLRDGTKDERKITD